MSPQLQTPGNYVFGVKDRLPMKGWPAGRARIRMRGGAFVQCFVKTETGIRKFWILEKDGCWIPGPACGENQRQEVSAP